MHVRFWELGNREVINCKDGKRLGHVGDLEIDLAGGCITCLYVPVGSRYCGCMERRGNIGFPIPAW